MHITKLPDTLIGVPCTRGDKSGGIDPQHSGKGCVCVCGCVWAGHKRGVCVCVQVFVFLCVCVCVCVCVQSIPVMARRNVSYVFSDHITTGNKKHAQQAAATKCDEGAECDGDTDMEGAAGDNSAGKKGSEGETYYEYE